MPVDDNLRDTELGSPGLGTFLSVLPTAPFLQLFVSAFTKVFLTWILLYAMAQRLPEKL